MNVLLLITVSCSHVPRIRGRHCVKKSRPRDLTELLGLEITTPDSEVSAVSCPQHDNASVTAQFKKRGAPFMLAAICFEVRGWQELSLRRCLNTTKRRIDVILMNTGEKAVQTA